MSKYYNPKFNQGVTLIELMVVLVIVAIFASIAIPSYQSYTRRATASAAKSEILKLAERLEQHKSRNFTYRGFTTTSVTLARGGYTIQITDDTTTGSLLTDSAANGQTWVIRATTTDSRNFNFIAKNSGLRCQSLTASAVDNDCGGTTTCNTCEANSESW
ncbi:prepilin-type N-terminal cleavage/methylation domain-containing protein [Acinetobacter calcoaceticus]|uniref:type IV pilin protein n=1 Tax=Acinetobacter calcoaceticus TaxID=471 RepID=UPI00190181C9|nr:type IV pilin protein [Acinetobacter calcoaceticus]MBJ9722048.1 prepilin-type N-terminal cleavage/methylation domain-containing protein [Acinetobacter calcoaceticus]